MPVHECRCTFIPPFILEHMAREGIEEARLTIQQSKISRENRDKRPEELMNKLAGVISVGRAYRQVYDSQNTYDLQKKLERSEGDPAIPDQVVNNVYDYVGNVHDYYKQELGRNSIDNNGMDFIINVHFGKKYNNAFWDGEQMTFGDGDGKIFVNFTKSLDVIAHEITHGVTQYEANFVYKGQSGALHEHFSDVFGSAITQYVNKQKAEEADWLVGDEIMGPELYGEALRSMKEPGTAYDNPILGKDPQPAHMKDYYTGSGDNYGVHINSGIPNKAFYLAAMDIGTDKAARIWYNALCGPRLFQTANFNDAFKAIVEAARILVKDNKVPLGSTQKVRAAFKAVGLPN